MQNLAGISAILKKQYLGLLRDVLQRIAWTWAWTKKGSLTWSGADVNWPVRMRGTNAMSWGVGGTALNSAQSQTTVSSVIGLKQGWLPIQFTYDAQLASRDSKGAFITTMTLEMDNGIKDFIDMMERLIWGDGTGKLGEVQSFSTVTVTTSAMTDALGIGVNGNASNRNVKQGMILDFYTSAGASRMTGAVVTSVDVDADTFVITPGVGSNPTGGDGFYLARPDLSTPVDQEPMGIPGIIDDGTLVTSLQTISRTTYPQWASQLITAGTFASPGNLSSDLVQRGIDKARMGSPGGDVQLWMAPSVKREFIKLGQVDVRFTPHQLLLGINENQNSDDTRPKNSMSFNGYKICWAPDTPWNTIFGMPEGLVRQYPVLDGPSWVPNNPGSGAGGGILQRLTGVGGTYEAQLSWMGNIGTDLRGPNSGFVIRNVNSTIDRVAND